MFISRKNSLNSDIELPTEANFSNNFTLLHVNLDSRLSYTKQVSSVCHRCYSFQRKNYFMRDTVDIRSLIGIVRVTIHRDQITLTVLWTTCVYYTEITVYNDFSMLSHFLAITWFTNSKLYQRASLAPMKQRVLYKFLLFGHRLVRLP